MSKPKPEISPAEDVLKAPPHCVGPEKSVVSSCLQEPERFLRLAKNEGITSGDFYLPEHRTLFGFISELHHEGVEIELVSLVQHLHDRGLLDRVGGPSTVAELHNYAVGGHYFQEHLEMVKSKSILREIIASSNEQIKAAYEQPGEVKELIELVGANLERVRKKTESRQNNLKKYREQIVTAESMQDGVRDYLNGDRVMGGDPFFLPDFALAFRKHEWTVFVGTSFHGKSSAVENQVANLAVHGRKSIVASFEQAPEVTFAKILNTMVADPEIARRDHFQKAYDYLNSQVSIYKGRDRADPKHVLEMFRQAYLNDGTDTMVIDNLFTLAVDRGDNSALSNAIHMMRVFVAEYPVHLHLICHPRKPSDQDNGKPPTQNSIRGPAEVGDAPDNIVVVYRDMAKGEKIAEMKAANYSELEISRFNESTPCSKLIVRKQRLSGETPVANCWYHTPTNRFMTRPGVPRPMFEHGQAPWDLHA